MCLAFAKVLADEQEPDKYAHVINVLTGIAEAYERPPAINPGRRNCANVAHKLHDAKGSKTSKMLGVSLLFDALQLHHVPPSCNLCAICLQFPSQMMIVGGCF